MYKIFHHNDLDGISAAAVAYMYLQQEVSASKLLIDGCKFYELNHSPEHDTELLRSVTNEDEVIIVDYSFTEATLENFEYVKNNAKQFTWIDHHKSSIEFTDNHGFDVYGAIYHGLSGAALAWIFFMGDENVHDTLRHDPEIDSDALASLPLAIKYISDYDCWTQRFSPNQDLFKLGMDTEPWSTNPKAPEWKNLFNAYEAGTALANEYVKKGEAVKNYLDITYKNTRESIGFESELDGVKCFVVNSPGNSWVFGELIEQYPMVVLFRYDGEYYKYSLYSDSKSDIDCSIIAQNHGGGGHRGASGFASKEQILVKK